MNIILFTDSSVVFQKSHPFNICTIAKLKMNSLMGLLEQCESFGRPTVWILPMMMMMRRNPHGGELQMKNFVRGGGEKEGERGGWGKA